MPCVMHPLCMSQVVVWNRNPAKCEPLAAEGATVAASPADVARAATFTFAMLSDPEAALQVRP